MIFGLRFSRLALTLFIGIFFALTIAACSPKAASEPQNTPQANQQSGQPSGQELSGASSSSNEACDAFDNAGLSTGVTSTGIGNFFAQGNFSRTEPPGEVGQIAKFFQDAIEDALEQDVPIGCYWALNLTQQGDLDGRALWVSLELSGEPSSAQIQEIHDQLASRGATLFGFSNTQAAGQTLSIILIGDIPVGTAQTIGGTLVFSEEYAVLTVASSDLPAGSVPPAPAREPAASGISPSPTNAPGPTSVSQLPSGSQTISDWFEENLEDALGVTLNVESAFQSSASGQNTVLISFRIAEGSAAPDNVGGQFANIVNSSGASITSSLNVTGLSVVNFENLKVGGVTGMGSMSFTQEQSTILVTLQY